MPVPGPVCAVSQRLVVVRLGPTRSDALQHTLQKIASSAFPFWQLPAPLYKVQFVRLADKSSANPPPGVSHGTNPRLLRLDAAPWPQTQATKRGNPVRRRTEARSVNLPRATHCANVAPVICSHGVTRGRSFRSAATHTSHAPWRRSTSAFTSAFTATASHSLWPRRCHCVDR